VALGYSPGEGRAPEVVARGFGQLAERMLELARERGVPVREDADLAEVLARLDVGAEIPEELYEAVAELLAFIYRVNRGLAGAVRG
jgi:flagellar biosynthesis protein